MFKLLLNRSNLTQIWTEKLLYRNHWKSKRSSSFILHFHVIQLFLLEAKTQIDWSNKKICSAVAASCISFLQRIRQVKQEDKNSLRGRGADVHPRDQFHARTGRRTICWLLFSSNGAIFLILSEKVAKSRSVDSC